MNIKIKNILKNSCLVIGGILIGAILMNTLDMYVRPTYRDMIRTELMAEQEFLAARTSREHDLLRSVVHRWNVIDATAQNGFRAFREETASKKDKQFFLPFALLSLKFMKDDIYKNIPHKSIKLSEGLDRGKLAVALEAMGEKKEAAKQWELAKVLTGDSDINHIKRLVYDLLAQENSPAQLNAEHVILEGQQ